MSVLKSAPLSLLELLTSLPWSEVSLSWGAIESCTGYIEQEPAEEGLLMSFVQTHVSW